MKARKNIVSAVLITVIALYIMAGCVETADFAEPNTDTSEEDLMECL